MNALMKISKKAVPFVLLLTVCMVSSSKSEVKAASVKFSDIPTNHWAKSGIDTAVNKGYVVGYPGGLFMPNANVTRAEFIKMVVTATGQPVEETTGKWYESYVTAAEQAALYIKSDFANSDTEWNKKITRQEMARIAARATGLKTTEDDKWMYLATKSGLISGLGKGRLGETESTTRAQSVVIIERILSTNGGSTLKPDKYAVSNAELLWHGTNIFTVMPDIFTTGDPVKDVNAADLWKEEKMKITSKDGLYSAQLDALIAIDLADKNDPNLDLIPDVSTLKWKNTADNTTNGIRITEKYMNSYLLYSKAHINFNKDTTRYSKTTFFTAEVLGTTNLDRKSFVNGNLNSQALVFQKVPFDLPMTILPKSGWVQDGKIIVWIKVPSLSAFYLLRNEILSIAGPYKK
ncbi:S-layer homology domain-containing protein [Paenibacillus sp. HW567]|uniref:S-layer homology domain-containing protein n=1 Tax=Paenibacillus sp. HW567 TaxID=1034769 RepID=UPI00037D0F9A|nr:S-layer homology domain-containing protein [Paenibacillus sp. HW567]